MNYLDTHSHLNLTQFDTDRAQLIVMTSDNDSDKAEMSRTMITDALPNTDVRMFPGYGHFIPDHLKKKH